MRYKIYRILILLFMIGIFFFPIMHQRDAISIKLNGFEAILYGSYFVIGNIVLGSIIFLHIIHTLWTLLELIIHDKLKNYVDKMNIVVNITVILSLVMVTFLGTFLEPLGFVFIALSILTTYLRYVEQKSS